MKRYDFTFYFTLLILFIFCEGQELGSDRIVFSEKQNKIVIQSNRLIY